MFEQFKNPNGTYNGIELLASLSGLSIQEVTWTANRMKQLMTVEGKSKTEAIALVTEEAKSKPWVTK